MARKQVPGQPAFRTKLVRLTLSPMLRRGQIFRVWRNMTVGGIPQQDDIAMKLVEKIKPKRDDRKLPPFGMNNMPMKSSLSAFAALLFVGISASGETAASLGSACGRRLVRVIVPALTPAVAAWRCWSSSAPFPR